MHKLFLIRGLPGSGKTTLAYSLYGLNDHQICTDDFFMKYCDVCRDDDEIPHRCISNRSGEAVYVFDPKKLGENHEKCQAAVESYLEEQTGNIFVHNTFSQRWEMEPYIKLAHKYDDVDLFVIDLFDNGCTDEELVKRNSHGVSRKAIQRKRASWEFDWKNGDPHAPREHAGAASSYEYI